MWTSAPESAPSKNRAISPKVSLVLVLTVLCSALSSWAEEDIKLFQIEVRPQLSEDLKTTESLHVKERVQLNFEHRHYVWGMRRQFPRKLIMPSNEQQLNVSYQFMTAAINEKTAPFREMTMVKHLFVEIGDPQKGLPKGVQKIDFEYKVMGNIRKTENYEEFYWIAKTQYPPVPVRKMKISFVFPKGINIQKEAFQAYVADEKESRATIQKIQTKANRVDLYSTETIQPNQQVVVYMRW